MKGDVSLNDTVLNAAVLLVRLLSKESFLSAQQENAAVMNLLKKYHEKKEIQK